MTGTRTALVVLLALVVGGCATFEKLVEPRPALHDTGMAGYALQLSSFDAEARAHALEAAMADWQETNSAHARAKLGLARGQGGYAGYDPVAAVADLRAALATDAAAQWAAYDRAFLSLRAAQLENRLAQQASQAELAAENEYLRHALQEAEGKLQAITEIEKTLGQE